MSTPDTSLDTEVSTPTTSYATLVRGRVYFLGDKEFLNGQTIEVTQEQREWLEDHAVDEVSVEGEGEYQSRAKFRFSATAAPVEASAPRSRRRG